MSNQGLSIFDHDDNSGDEPTQVIPREGAEQGSGTQKTAQKVAEKVEEKPAEKPAAGTAAAACSAGSRPAVAAGRRPRSPRGRRTGDPAARHPGPGGPAPVAADRASRRLRHRCRRQAPAHRDRGEGRPRPPA